ncbi:MAG: hypothetical protein QG670_101 [Thermoproteota archaeon]|nr:hypothetical protein [Thermoproteota archaeon]
MPALEESIAILLDNMRITLGSEKNVELFGEQSHFYMKYNFFVLNTLKKPLFQRFLNWMLKKEEIDEYRVKDVQIRMFPFKKENGNGLVGSCNSKGKIILYPKGPEFCQGPMLRLGRENAKYYVKSRARAALIHELLHLKYEHDEEKVRELTRKYFNIYAKHQGTRSPEERRIASMILNGDIHRSNKSSTNEGNET